jgi:hypothetical protein
MTEVFNAMTMGAVAMAFAVAGMIFFRFWRKTGDRLFGLFALSFFVSAANRIASGIAINQGYSGDSFYWIRFAAFALILAAILEKNRTATAA